MTASRNPDQLIRAFLSEGVEELSDAVYDSVREQLHHNRQRVVFGPWRFPAMNNTFRIGVAAAVVVIAAILGFTYLNNQVGNDATPTPQPTSSVAATPEASVAAGLPLGPFALALPGDLFSLAMTVTIPAPGWGGEVNNGILVKGDNTGPPRGNGLIVFTGDYLVYGDPCRWSTTVPDAPATTVDELVAALAAQPSRDASTPVDVTLGGYAGKSIVLHVPDDLVLGECDGGNFGSWEIAGSPEAGPDRYAQGLGQIDEVSILDVNGELVVIDAAYYAGTPAQDVAELRAIVDSITFE